MEANFFENTQHTRTNKTRLPLSHADDQQVIESSFLCTESREMMVLSADYSPPKCGAVALPFDAMYL